MSKRTGIVGLSVSALLLLLTIVVVTGAGPELPGPPVRDWLGVGEPPLPDLCKFDPGKIRDPSGTPSPGAWRRERRSPTPSPELGAAAVGDSIYLVGGQLREGTEPTVLRFSARTGEYRRETDLPVAIDHPVVAAHDGEVVVASGYIDGSQATDRAWAYSPQTKRWRELPSMHTARGAAAGSVVGDRLYVAGGLTEFGNEYQPLDSMEVYDFSEERWLPAPPMPTARHHFAAATLGGKAYFAGGRTRNDLTLDAFEEFDPAKNRWYRLPRLPSGSGAPGVAAAAGKVIVTGGGQDVLPGKPGGWILRTTYAYDPGTERWSRLPDMHRARHGHAAAAVDGRVYVFRGAPCPGYGEMSSAESLRLR